MTQTFVYLPAWKYVLQKRFQSELNKAIFLSWIPRILDIKVWKILNVFAS